MNPYFKIFSFFIISLALNTILNAQEIEYNKKIIIQDNDDIKPMKPYVNDCCYKVDLDLIPSEDRKSGHLNRQFQKIHSEVPKEDNRLKDGSRLKGYDVIDKSGESKMRSNLPELKVVDSVIHESQTQRLAVNNEGRITEMIQRDAKVFIRKVNSLEVIKIPTNQRVNGEGSFGRQLDHLIPRDQNPLKNGSMLKGYDYILSSEYFGRLLAFDDRPFSEIPSETFISNRRKNEIPVEPVPASKNGFLDCR